MNYQLAINFHAGNSQVLIAEHYTEAEIAAEGMSLLAMVNYVTVEYQERIVAVFSGGSACLFGRKTERRFKEHNPGMTEEM